MLSEVFFDAAWAPRRPSLNWLQSLLPAVRAAEASSAIDESDPTRAVVATAARVVGAVRRVLGVELHDEQVMAGIAMCAGWGVQMRTGEGKTFAAIHPAYLFGRLGEGVHVMTANDYLARRDAEWVGGVLRDLGLTVGVTAPGMTRDAVRAAYAADVTYGAERDFGFDFLRDGLWLPGDAAVQRGRVVAVVDEADAVLVDQARTPLVLSAPAPAAVDVIRRAAQVVAALGADDVEVDAKTRDVRLSDDGITACEHALGVDDLFTDAVDWPIRIDMALRARHLLARDHDYVVGERRIHVVDEVTGRVVEGRQWGDGLQQAVEAKEGVAITQERRDIARISIGSFIAGYRLVVGMSGTLEGAERELAAAVAMPVLVIPTHRPIIRTDQPDVAFADRAAQHAAVADDVVTRHGSGQPVLIGTRSIEDSRRFSAALVERGVPHTVLSAEHPEREAAIVAKAGHCGAVTVATQMAGRGVDIQLHDAPDGLMVWALGHHPSRRLDHQLRGRAGRQGDPGTTCFATSPDDDVPAAEQTMVEQLEAVSRHELRVVAAVHDRVQDVVTTWRARARQGDLETLLRDAVDTELGPKLKRRRRREAVDAAYAALDVHPEVARLVLGELLVRRWADFLASFDAYERYAQLAGSLHRAAIDVGANQHLIDFLTHTKLEWLTHLRQMQIR
ncbi:MAG: preprotein translocase subunit SecA, partial [Actinomycetota bacterium]